MNAVGRRIREHYLNAGYSRRGYADHVGVREGTIRRLEDGLSVHPASAKKIADDMGLRVVDLMPIDPEGLAA